MNRVPLMLAGWGIDTVIKLCTDELRELDRILTTNCVSPLPLDEVQKQHQQLVETRECLKQLREIW